MAWVLLGEEAGLLVLGCVSQCVSLSPQCSCVEVSVRLLVGTGASSLGLMGPFLRVAIFAICLAGWVYEWV